LRRQKILPITQIKIALKQGYKVALLVFVVLLIDQWSKFYVKTHFEYNEDYSIFGLDWARIHFVENEGMAFGIIFEWTYGKLLLSSFRILMVAGLIWYIRMLMDAKAPAGFIFSVGLITAGALGNIIDSAFYGLIFSESYHNGMVAELVPFGKGYGTFLHGKVVDMLYFPIKYIQLPDWLGGENFLFFSPIFNVADSAITTGVLSILLFQRKFFSNEMQTQADHAAAQATELATHEFETIAETSDVVDEQGAMKAEDETTPATGIDENAGNTGPVA
jgi:signal peptidase II